MDPLAIFDKILSSKYPVLAMAAYITWQVMRGIKANWPGLTKFMKESVNRWLTDKEQQIEIQVELELQIKSLVATQNTFQEQLKELIAQNQAFRVFLEELSHKLEFLSEGFWENRRTIEAYFKKTDALWGQIGVLPLEKPE